MTAELTWRCDKCAELIEGHGGAVLLDYGDLRTAQRLREEQHRQLMFDALHISAEATAHWRVLHDHCGALEASENGYWIGCERLRSSEALLDLTCHLADKAWISHTDWPAFVRRTQPQINGAC